MPIQIRYLPDEDTGMGVGAYAPTLVCDICGRPIEDLGLGVYAFVNRSDACPQEALIAHKGDCHDRAEEQLEAGDVGSAGWGELRTLPARLANNSNPAWPDQAYDLVRRDTD